MSRQYAAVEHVANCSTLPACNNQVVVSVFVNVATVNMKIQSSIIGRRLCFVLRPRPHSLQWVTLTLSSAASLTLSTTSTRSHGVSLLAVTATVMSR